MVSQEEALYCNVLNMYMKALVSYVTTLYYNLIRLHHSIRLWVGTLYCSGMNMYLHICKKNKMERTYGNIFILCYIGLLCLKCVKILSNH